MIITIVNIISSAISICLVNYFFSSQKEKMRRSRINILLLVFFICYLILSTIIKDLASTFWKLLLILSIYVLLGHRHKVSASHTFFWSIILLGTVLGAEFVGFLFMLPLASAEKYAHQEVFIVINIILTTLIEIISVILLKKFVYRNVNDGQKFHLTRLLAFLSIPVISTLLMHTLLLQTIYSQEFSFLLILIFFVGLTIVNLSVVYLYVNLSKQYSNHEKMSLEKERLEQEIKFYEQVKQSQQEIRSIKHDLRNKLLVLLNRLENGETFEAIKTIKQTLSNMSSRKAYILTEHQALNFLLNEKYKQAEALGVSLEVKSFIPKSLNIDDEILVAIFGNLLDNAIQACSRLKDERLKTVKIEITFFKNRLIIEMSNPFDVEEKITRKSRFTEGIGRKNIVKLVEKNGGIYESWYEDSKYFACIVLFNLTY